ncbi:hypothetical protein ENBRE01_0154 [Enteropsectra breve]|nr:hypothetical protein ENBRE01_0154 [Enteropsectra breve]
MYVSNEFRHKMIITLIETLKDSPSFCNIQFEQIKEAVLNCEQQIYGMCNNKEQYVFAIQEKLRKIKGTAVPPVNTPVAQPSYANAYAQQRGISMPQYTKRQENSSMNMHSPNGYSGSSPHEYSAQHTPKRMGDNNSLFNSRNYNGYAEPNTQPHSYDEYNYPTQQRQQMGFNQFNSISKDEIRKFQMNKSFIGNIDPRFDYNANKKKFAESMSMRGDRNLSKEEIQKQIEMKKRKEGFYNREIPVDSLSSNRMVNDGFKISHQKPAFSPPVPKKMDFCAPSAVPENASEWGRKQGVPKAPELTESDQLRKKQEEEILKNINKSLFRRGLSSEKKEEAVREEGLKSEDAGDRLKLETIEKQPNNTHIINNENKCSDSKEKECSSEEEHPHSSLKEGQNKNDFESKNNERLRPVDENNLQTQESKRLRIDERKAYCAEDDALAPIAVSERINESKFPSNSLHKSGDKPNETASAEKSVLQERTESMENESSSDIKSILNTSLNVSLAECEAFLFSDTNMLFAPPTELIDRGAASVPEELAKFIKIKGYLILDAKELEGTKEQWAAALNKAISNIMSANILGGPEQLKEAKEALIMQQKYIKNPFLDLDEIKRLDASGSQALDFEKYVNSAVSAFKEKKLEDAEATLEIGSSGRDH